MGATSKHKLKVQPQAEKVLLHRISLRAFPWFVKGVGPLAPASVAAAHSAATSNRRGVLRAMFGSAMSLGFSALGCVGALWAAATARFMMPNAVAEPSHRFKVGPPSHYPFGFVQTKYSGPFGVWVVHGALSRPAADLRAAHPSVPIWAASRSGNRTSNGSNVPATAADSASMAQFRGPRAAPPWNGARSDWPKTDRSRLTEAEPFTKSSASGPIGEALWKDKR